MEEPRDGVIRSARDSACRGACATLFVSLVTALALVVLCPGTALADDTGWKDASADEPVTVWWAGDGDGFELNSDKAYGDGGGSAENLNNGWVGLAKYNDRHRYGAYGISLPPGAFVTGI
jgi:hypothetical protein